MDIDRHPLGPAIGTLRSNEVGKETAAAFALIS